MKTPPILLASTVLASITPFALQAAEITMINNNTGEESWLTAGDWSNNAAPTSDNDYVVGAGFQVRSPANVANATFQGGSLTVTGLNASLLLRTQSGGTTSSIGTLTISNGAAIRNGFSASSGSNNTQILNGTLLTFEGGVAGYTSVITGGRTGNQSSTGGPRNITFNTAIAGSGEVRLQDRGTILLNNAANTFSGTWVVGGGPNNTSLELTTRLAHGAGSGTFFGVNSSITLAAYSYLDLAYDWTTSGSLILDSNGGVAGSVQMKFTNNISVGSLSIAGTAFDPGTYTFADFSTAGFGNYFDGTTGMITVIPEPSAFAALAGLGALGLVASRRRRR